MKVSICCITYNHEEYIDKALEGFLMQEFDDYEIVISDDCSSDGTVEKLIEIKERYPNKVKLLLNDKNLGMEANFKQALKACTGKYIALCEGDDYWTDPSKLQKQVNFLEEYPAYSICWTLTYRDDRKINLFHDSTTERFHSLYPKDVFIDINNVDNIHQYNVTRTLTVLFRNVISTCKIDDLKYFCDTVLFNLLLEKGKGAILNSYCGVYRVHSGGVFQGASDIYKKAIALGTAVDVFIVRSGLDLKRFLNLFSRYCVLKNNLNTAYTEKEKIAVNAALEYYTLNVNTLIRFIYSTLYFIRKRKPEYKFI